MCRCFLFFANVFLISQRARCVLACIVGLAQGGGRFACFIDRARLILRICFLAVSSDSEF